jgi:phytanoyl-CoA hydroxylase
MSHILTPEAIAQFRHDGFLNYTTPVLTEEELQSLRDALRRVTEGTSEKSTESNRNISWGKEKGFVVQQIVNIWEAEDAFRAHLFNDRIVSLVSQLLGTDTVRVWHDQIQVKPAEHGGPTTWHQDHPYWPVIQPADLISAWVALEDATIENGCMWMVPQSHKWGPHKGGTIGTDTENGTWGPLPNLSLLPEGVDTTPVAIPVKAGCVAFHHCLTWHGAPVNLSPNPRPAIAVHYMPGWTRYEPTAAGHMVEHHITVKPGEALVGEHFPTVLENGVLLTP